VGALGCVAVGVAERGALAACARWSSFSFFSAVTGVYTLFFAPRSAHMYTRSH